MELKALHLAPLAPQFWGEPEFQSPPGLRPLGTLREGAFESKSSI